MPVSESKTGLVPRAYPESKKFLFSPFLANPKSAFSAMCSHIVLKSRLQICSKIIENKLFLTFGIGSCQIDLLRHSKLLSARSIFWPIFDSFVGGNIRKLI